MSAAVVVSLTCVDCKCVLNICFVFLNFDLEITKDRAVVENGVVVVRPMNYFAMSYDHRIIDGREAVLGLVAMKEALEDPARLLFDI